MKRIVAFVLPMGEGKSPAVAGLAASAGRTSSKRDAASGSNGAAETSELKLEACLSDGQAQRIVDSLLERDAGSEVDSLIDDLLHVSLALAGPNASDLHERIVGAVERQLISRVYAECDHVKTKASARLGINRNTLHKRLKHHHLLSDDDSEDDLDSDAS
jgi:DNA-binding protein Fis